MNTNFSNKLDEILTDTPTFTNINTFESFLVESIIQASESEIPKFYNHENKYP